MNFKTVSLLIGICLILVSVDRVYGYPSTLFSRDIWTNGQKYQVDEEDATGAVALCDSAFAAYSAAALSMIPKGAAED